MSQVNFKAAQTIGGDNNSRKTVKARLNRKTQTHTCESLAAKSSKSANIIAHVLKTSRKYKNEGLQFNKQQTVTDDARSFLSCNTESARLAPNASYLLNNGLCRAQLQTAFTQHDFTAQFLTLKEHAQKKKKKKKVVLVEQFAHLQRRGESVAEIVMQDA